MWKKLLGVGLGLLSSAASIPAQWDGAAALRIPVIAAPLSGGSGQVFVAEGAPLYGGQPLTILALPDSGNGNVDSFATKLPGNPLADSDTGSVGWPCERAYANFEFLYWATQGINVVPLVTTGPAMGPPGTAGSLGQPATHVLFGGQRMLNSFRPGYRVEAGAWMDAEQTFGVSSRFFDLGVAGSGLAGGSDGSQLLALPLVVPLDPGGPPVQAARPVGFPGLARGTFDVNTSTNFLGTDLSLRRMMARAGGQVGTVRRLPLPAPRRHAEPLFR